METGNQAAVLRQAQLFDYESWSEGASRKSLALYYHTPERNGAGPGKSRLIIYRRRPSDAPVQSALIWADKQAVNLYPRLKEGFRLPFPEEVN